MDLAIYGGYPADFPGLPILSYVYTKEEIKTNAYLSSALAMVSSGRQTQPKQQKKKQNYLLRTEPVYNIFQKGC